MSQTWNLPMADTNSVSSDRATLNDGLESLRTNHSGTAAPSSTVAYMFWVDTTNNELKIRNAGDSAFIILGKSDTTNLGLVRRDGSDSAMTGNLSVNGADNLILDLGRSGDTANARIDFDDDGDTSLRASADDTLQVEIAGTDRIEITSSHFNSQMQLTAGGDSGGVASRTGLTNATAANDTTAAALGNTPTGIAAGNAAWIKIYVGTTTAYVPYWTA